MAKKTPTAVNPLILQCHRLMEAFAKSDDERDFYLDRVEGFVIFVELDKSDAELSALQAELDSRPERYCLIPKMSFYESKKMMEGFVNEKVYDIDTKEKLLDIIQAKEARENFLEFLHDHHSELDKWQQYYQERSRVRIIEWLRSEDLMFVFEEDVDVPGPTMEKVKKHLFDEKAPRDVTAARKVLASKAATYYSNEALNPRPKRGRPPKQAAKVDNEPRVTQDCYSQVPAAVHPFLFTPDVTSPSLVSFSSKFESEQDLLEHLRSNKQVSIAKLDDLSTKLASLRSLTAQVGKRKSNGESDAPKKKTRQTKKASDEE